MSIPELLELLFATLPVPKGTGDMRVQIRAYGLALSDLEPRDIEATILRFIQGKVEGHNKAFAPAAPLLAATVREARDERLDRERRDRMAERPKALAKPDVPPPSDEERARVKAMVDNFVMGAAKAMRAAGMGRD